MFALGRVLIGKRGPFPGSGFSEWTLARLCILFERSVVLLCFDVDSSGIARTAAAQLVAYWSGIVFLVEELLPLVIGRPSAVATVIPASDARIGSGSKCNAIGHCALPSPQKGAVAFHAKFERWSLDIEPFGPKKDTCANADGVFRRTLWREQDL